MLKQMFTSLYIHTHVRPCLLLYFKTSRSTSPPARVEPFPILPDILISENVSHTAATMAEKNVSCDVVSCDADSADASSRDCAVDDVVNDERRHPFTVIKAAATKPINVHAATVDRAVDDLAAAACSTASSRSSQKY